MRKLIVNKKYDNKKLNTFILNSFQEHSQNMLGKALRQKDIRINVVNHKPVCSILRYNDFDFRSNISNGGKAIKYEPNKEFLDLAIKASRALNLDFGTVDMLLDEFNHPIVCELNSNPQFKSTFDVTNVDLSDYIRDYIISKL